MDVSRSRPSSARSKTPVPNAGGSRERIVSNGTTSNTKIDTSGSSHSPVGDGANQTSLPTDLEFGLGDTVYIDGDIKKRGKVKYIGYPPFASGLYVGLEFQVPIGRNDGSIQGKRYFQCKLNHGLFVRAVVCSTKVIQQQPQAPQRQSKPATTGSIEEFTEVSQGDHEPVVARPRSQSRGSNIPRTSTSKVSSESTMSTTNSTRSRSSTPSNIRRAARPAAVSNSVDMKADVMLEKLRSVINEAQRPNKLLSPAASSTIANIDTNLKTITRVPDRSINLHVMTGTGSASYASPASISPVPNQPLQPLLVQPVAAAVVAAAAPISTFLAYSSELDSVKPPQPPSSTSTGNHQKHRDSSGVPPFQAPLDVARNNNQREISELTVEQEARVVEKVMAAVLETLHGKTEKEALLHRRQDEQATRIAEIFDKLNLVNTTLIDISNATTAGTVSLQSLSHGVAGMQQELLKAAESTENKRSTEELVSVVSKQREEIEQLKVALFTVSQLSKRAQASLGLERDTSTSTSSRSQQ